MARDRFSWVSFQFHSSILILIEGNEIVTTLYSGDSHIYIWMLGDGSIGLVNPDTMVYDLVANFFGGP